MRRRSDRQVEGLGDQKRVKIGPMGEQGRGAVWCNYGGGCGRSPWGGARTRSPKTRRSREELEGASTWRIFIHSAYAF